VGRNDVRFSCITFGAPSIFSKDITPTIRGVQTRLARPGLLLAFALNGDPVPRMDAAYSRVVAYLYHRAGEEEFDTSMVRGLVVPPLSLFRLGDIVVLSDETISSEGFDVGAYLWTEESLAKSVWLNLFAHKKIEYVRFLGEVGSGRLNGRQTWRSVNIV
jgi:hypothetical protein